MGLLDRVARSLAHIADASRVVHTYHVEDTNEEEFAYELQAQNAQRARERREHRRGAVPLEFGADETEFPFEPTIVVKYREKVGIVGNVGDETYIASRMREGSPGASPTRRLGAEDGSPISDAKFLRAATRNPEGRVVRMVGDRIQWENDIAALEAQAAARRHQINRRQRRGEDVEMEEAPYSHIAHYSGPDDDDNSEDGDRLARPRYRSHEDAVSLLAPSLVARRFTHRHVCVGTDIDVIRNTSIDGEAEPLVVLNGRSWMFFVTLSAIAFLLTLGTICYMAFGRHYLGAEGHIAGCDPQQTTVILFSPATTTSVVESDTVRVFYRCGPVGYPRLFYPQADWEEGEKFADPLFGFTSQYMPDMEYPFTNFTPGSTQRDYTHRFAAGNSKEVQAAGDANAAYRAFMDTLDTTGAASYLKGSNNVVSDVITAPASDFPAPHLVATRDMNGMFTGGIINVELAGEIVVAGLAGGLVFVFLVSVHIVCCVNGCCHRKHIGRLDEQHKEFLRQRQTGELYTNNTYRKRPGTFTRARKWFQSIGRKDHAVSDSDVDEGQHQAGSQRRAPSRAHIEQDRENDPDDRSHHAVDHAHSIPNHIQRRFGSVLEPLFLVPANHTETLTANIDKENKRIRGMRRVLLYFVYVLFGFLPGVLWIGVGMDVCDRFASSTNLLSVTNNGRSPSYMFVFCFFVFVAITVPPYWWYMNHAVQYVRARYH